MSAVLISDLASSLWEPAPYVEKFPIVKGSGQPTGKRALPTVQPGQLWFVELPAAELELSPLEYRALTTANVVIYDRSLAPTVARFLPLGGYAEPAAPSDGASDATWERCLRFARDGWSVARLVDPRVKSVADKIGLLSERLLTPKAPADLPVLVFANAGGGAYQKSEARL